MGELETQLHKVLAEHSDLTARELAWRLRSLGRRVHKRELNPLLYRDARFTQDGGYVPRWRLAEHASSRVDLQTRIASNRARREQLDAHQAQVAALKAGIVGRNEVEGDDSELAAALELLRRHGIDGPGPHEPAASLPSDRSAPSSRTKAARKPAPAKARRAAPGAAPVPAPRWGIKSLHPWQQEALLAWYAAGCVGVCEAVTGTGKTHLGLEAVAQTVRQGRRATVLVPSLLLQRQWELRLEQHVPEAVIAKVGGNPRGAPATADVVIAVVHSATRQDLSQVGTGMELLVADEVHRYGGEGWSAALRAGYARRLGLTATLERAGDEGVEDYLLPYFTGVVHSYGYDRATQENVVAPFDLIFLGVSLTEEESTEYDTLRRRISQARKVLLRAGGSPATLHRQLGALRGMGGDVTRAVMAFENATRERRRLLADTPAKQEAVSRLAEFVSESDGTIIFTQSVSTATAAADVLQAEGISAEAIFSASMSAARRQRLISDLGDGALQALAAPKILDEGVDVPDVNLGIVMGASSSRRQMIQRLGRVIRLKPNNGQARFVILYVNDTVEDPETGAREDFMSEVEDAATRVMLLRDWDEDDLSAVWAGQGPAWSASDAGGETDSERPIDAAAVERPITLNPEPPRDGNRRRPAPERLLPRPRVPAPHNDSEIIALLHDIEQTRALLQLMRDEVGQP